MTKPLTRPDIDWLHSTEYGDESYDNVDRLVDEDPIRLRDEMRKALSWIATLEEALRPFAEDGCQNPSGWGRDPDPCNQCDGCHAVEVMKAVTNGQGGK